MKKKLAVMCTLACLVFNNIIPVMAKGHSSPTDNANVPISYDMESIFTVTLPEGINGGNNSSVDFDYSVEGNIASNEVVTVKPISNTFTLSDIKNKTVDANVSIPKTDFNSSEIVTKNTQTGTVSVENLPAGKWSGVCKFLINLKVVKPAGLYDADGNMLAPLTIEDMNKSYSSSNMLPCEKGIEDFNSVTEAVLPEGTTNIPQYSFYYCEGLKTVNIPDTVRTIGENAFHNCTNLESPIVIPEGVAVIENNVFANCHKVPSIELPSSLTKLNYGAFKGCIGVTSITIPNSVISIDMKSLLNVPHVYYYGPASLAHTGVLSVN